MTLSNRDDKVNATGETLFRSCVCLKGFTGYHLMIDAMHACHLKLALGHQRLDSCHRGQVSIAGKQLLPCHLKRSPKTSFTCIRLGLKVSSVSPSQCLPILCKDIPCQ